MYYQNIVDGNNILNKFNKGHVNAGMGFSATGAIYNITVSSPTTPQTIYARATNGNYTNQLVRLTVRGTKGVEIYQPMYYGDLFLVTFQYDNELISYEGIFRNDQYVTPGPGFKFFMLTKELLT